MTVDEALKAMDCDEDCATSTLQAEVRRLREEHDRCYPHGIDIAGYGVLYGKETTCKLLGAWMQELYDFRRKEARTEEIEKLRAELAEAKQLLASQSK